MIYILIWNKIEAFLGSNDKEIVDDYYHMSCYKNIIKKNIGISIFYNYKDSFISDFKEYNEYDTILDNKYMYYFKYNNIFNNSYYVVDRGDKYDTLYLKYDKYLYYYKDKLDLY